MIRLRKLSQQDFIFLQTILSNPNLMLMGWGKTYSDKETQSWLDKILEQYRTNGYSYFMAINDQGQSIGLAGLLPTTIEGRLYNELAYIVREEYQMQGYGRQIIQCLLEVADRTYQLNQVVAQVNEEHHLSKNLLISSGFTYFFRYLREQNDQFVAYDVYQQKLPNEKKRGEAAAVR